MLSHTSLLFVPGSRPDRFARAREAGAGLVVIDLEDAVAADAKNAARDNALVAVAEDRSGLAIRINPPTTRAGVTDLHHLADAPVLPDVLLVPMVESAGELAVVRGALGQGCPTLVPLVETPCGLRHALAIASAQGVAAVMFGGGDFSGELGVALAWEPLLLARQQLVLACAEAGVAAIDVPFVRLDDESGLAEECGRARDLGFAAKAAIHPAQIAAIRAAFAPTPSEIEEASRAIAAFEEAGGQAIRHEGHMLEAPLVKHYRAVLAREGVQANA